MAIDRRLRQTGRFARIEPENAEHGLPPRIARLAHVAWEPCWSQQLKTEGKSANTIKSYLCGTRMFIRTSLTGEPVLRKESIGTVSVQHLAQRIDPDNGRLDIWLHSMNELKPATVNARLAAVGHLLEWTGHRIPDHICRLSRGKQMPKVLSNEELERVRKAAYNSENPLAHLFVTLLLETGIRVSELCGLDTHDVDLEDLSARVVGGKGNKDRMVLFTDQTSEILESWFVLRSTIDLADEDALLVNSRGRRITPRAVQKLMDRVAQEAGLARSRLSPHTLRHNFATGLLRRGADLVSIQRLLGHASIQTTRVYLEIDDRTLRQVYARAQDPSRFDEPS